MKRRLFVTLLSAAGAFAALGPRGLLKQSFDTPDTRAALIADRAGELFHDPDHARRIGRAYVRTIPARLNRDLLLGDLAIRLGWNFRTTDSETLRQRLAVRIRLDMEGDQTVVVNGWVLAETEARACALLALS